MEWDREMALKQGPGGTVYSDQFGVVQYVATSASSTSPVSYPCVHHRRQVARHLHFLVFAVHRISCPVPQISRRVLQCYHHPNLKSSDLHALQINIKPYNRVVCKFYAISIFAETVSLSLR